MYIAMDFYEGGMGVVYKAHDTTLDRFVALKFLPPHLGQNAEEKKRFIHEAKAASSLDHPNICTIHEIGETDDGQMYIAMAFYEGEPLTDKSNVGRCLWTRPSILLCRLRKDWRERMMRTSSIGISSRQIS